MRWIKAFTRIGSRVTRSLVVTSTTESISAPENIRISLYTADLIVWIELLCYAKIFYRFNCWLESKPVDQWVICTVILPLMKLESTYSVSAPTKRKRHLCTSIRPGAKISIIPLFVFNRILTRNPPPNPAPPHGFSGYPTPCNWDPTI